MKQILCNKYEVLKVIAEGGLGIVYLVKDLHLNKLAAVKVCKNPKSSREREFAFSEMEVLKELSHPALPGIIDFFEEKEQLCLVMEYVDGITLEQYLRKFGKVEVSLAVKWAIELSEVLQYLHSCNPPIIYRDLKPANIMIQPDGKLKLIDFGAAFSLSYGQQREQMMVGTPGYSAPEQWQSGNAGKPSDIYGLGAVLYEMLTGVGSRQLFTERKPVREYDRSISRELEKVVLTCLKKRPKERYQSMEQLKKALLGCGKKGKLRNSLFGIRKGIGAALFLLAGIRLFIPLLQGVEKSSFPMPYLEEPIFLLLLAFAYKFLFLRKSNKKQGFKKQEKSVFLTEKKFLGIYVSGILLLLFSGMAWQIKLTYMSVFAAEKYGGYEMAAKKEETSSMAGTEKLFIEMRDEENRKLLLKDGSVYPVNKRVRLELPAERMPEGEIALKLVAAGEDGASYESRIFLLKKEE